MKKLMKKEKEKMRLQRNFLQNEIKRLNKKYNVHMFTTKILEMLKPLLQDKKLFI